MADKSNQETTAKGIPALSLGTLTNFVNNFKTVEQIPTHIDKSMFPGTMSGANQSALLSALRFLGFTAGDNKPLPLFEAYVNASPDDRPVIWRDCVMASYAFVFKHVDIERTTAAAVADRFRAQQISGDTVRKAVTFFLHAAKAGKIKISEHVKAPRPIRGASRSKAGKTDSQGAGAKDAQHSGGGGQQQRQHIDRLPHMLVDILNSKMTTEETEAVWTLIRYLKAQESGSE